MRKIKSIIICAATLLMCLIPAAACKSKEGNVDSSSPVIEERKIEMFTVPENISCGAGSYFVPVRYAAYDNYGMKINSQLTVYDANRQPVSLDEKGGFWVEQGIGTKYYITYNASVDNDYSAKIQTVTVLNDSETPLLTILENDLLVSEGDKINIKNFYNVTDDSGIECPVEYKITLNGESIDFSGETLWMDIGEYTISIRATDGSGHASEWEDLRITSRATTVVADFEVESDIKTKTSYGLSAVGNYKLERSTDIAHSGNYSMKWTKEAGSKASELKIVQGLNGETNGASLGKSHIYFGFWAYFMPKDDSGVINIKYTSTQYDPGYWWENALSGMWFYVDGKLVDSGACNGSRVVELPTKEWVYVTGEIVEYAWTAFSFLAEGYADNTFTAYIDDMKTAHMATANSTEIYREFFGTTNAKFDIRAELNPTIKQNLSTAQNKTPLYEVEKINNDGSATTVEVIDGVFNLADGKFRIYYLGNDGERAGLYTTVVAKETLNVLVDYDAFGNDMKALPEGVVNKSYKIPTYTLSIEGDIEVTVSYNSQNVTISNGAFVPTDAGEYIISYKATVDGTSEVFNYTVDIKTAFTAGNLATNLSTVNKEVAANVGEAVTIPSIEIVGGSGNKVQEVKVLFGEEVINIQKNTFIPEKEGTYSVIFTVSDYFDVLEESYEVTITNDGNPRFENIPVLPEQLVADSEYEIVAPEAFVYENGEKIEKTVTCYWEYNEVRTPFVDSFIPTVSNDGDEIKLIYVADGYEYVTDSYIVKILTLNGQVNSAAYFFLENGMEAKSNSEGLILTGYTSSKASYIAPLLSSPWSFSFGIDSTKNIGSFTIILSDYENESKQVVLKFSAASSKDSFSFVSVNGGKNVKVSGSFFNESKKFSLTFNGKSGTLMDGASSNIIAYLGNELGVIGKNGLQMQIIMEDVVGKFSLKCYMLNKQVLRLIDEDGIGPGLQLNGDLSLTYNMDEDVLIPSASSFDVFDLNVEPVVTLQRIGGDYITTEDGLVLNSADATKEYALRFKDSGQYLLTYSVEDSVGNPTSLVYTITVYGENIAPTLEVTGNTSQTIQAGKVYSIPNATAHDLNGNRLSVLVYIRYPNEHIIHVTDTQITFTEKGVYTIYFYTKDINGYDALKSITLTVK